MTIGNENAIGTISRYHYGTENRQRVLYDGQSVSRDLFNMGPLSYSPLCWPEGDGRFVGVTLPGVGVSCPAELGRGWWLCERLRLWTCVWCNPVDRCRWCSLGGDIGSLLILTGKGDDAGGGVLLDTFKCGRTLLWANDVGIWCPLHEIDPNPISGPILKSCGPNDERAPE